MKTTKFLLFAAIVLSSSGTIFAGAFSTYTLVNPCQPFAVITPIADTYGCFHFSVTNSAPSDPNAYYSWNFGDGSTAIGNPLIHCYSPVTSSTNITVTVSYNSPALCGAVPTSSNYTITLNPPVQNTCVQNTPSVSLSAKSVTVWSGSAIPEIIYNFSFGDGTSANHVTSHTYQTCGNYVIKVKNWDMNAPQDTCYSYAGVNISCNTSTTTGIKKNSINNLQATIFPNPASDHINISASIDIDEVRVTDLTGRTIYQNTYKNENAIRLDVSVLPQGAYFITLRVNGNSEKNMKFIKQ